MPSPNPFMTEVRVFPAERVQSLVWHSDQLIDWVSGDVRYDLDGTKRAASISYSYRFDAAVMSPSRKYTALYERLGTKAIVLRADGWPLREINRSFYHADVYEYPIAFFHLADGREALAHCPQEYCELQIEDPVTGQRWDVPGTGRQESLFHSRLAANRVGTRLLSAGWFWHPFDMVRVFDLKPVGEGQLSLESCDACCDQGTEVSSAAFMHSGRFVVTSAKGAEQLSDEPGERVRPGTIAVFDLDAQKLISLAPLEDEAGTLMPVGDDHVVGFYDHPKLIEITSGRVLDRWPEVKTGQQNSSILWHKSLPPPLAMDPANRRFAVADERQITVVTLA
jgi:hypothetical protein